MDQKDRKCGLCGGAVFCTYKTEKIEHPARDERGGFIFETKLDKETGQPYQHQVMVTFTVRGLGTWHCVRGCRKRDIKVTRFVGAGKEQERKVNGDGSYTIRDEYLRQVPVTRQIPVSF